MHNVYWDTLYNKETGFPQFTVNCCYFYLAAFGGKVLFSYKTADMPSCSVFVKFFLYTVAVCDCVFLLYDFLHSRSLRLCISSVRFLTQSQSATVYFFCTISYTVAVGDCVLYLYDFFLLSTFQSLISQT